MPVANAISGAMDLILNFLAGNLDDNGPSFGKKFHCLGVRTVARESPPRTNP